MGYMIMYSTCFVCKRVFGFNPMRVPSFQGHAICAGCIHLVNERRRAAGLAEWPVAPDAYEPVEAD